jgi:hypothetical protein
MAILLLTNLEQSLHVGERKQEVYTSLNDFVACAHCGGAVRGYACARPKRIS